MYATNANSQSIASRKRITDALLSLLEKHPYNEITITQICQEAQIVRQTYYRNFSQKDDILRLHVTNLLKGYYDKYYVPEDAPTRLVNLFTYMLLNKTFLLQVSKNKLFFAIEEGISQNITRFFPFEYTSEIGEMKFQRYVIGFISATICSLLSLWVENNFKETPEELSSLAQKFMGGLE